MIIQQRDEPKERCITLLSCAYLMRIYSLHYTYTHGKYVVCMKLMKLLSFWRKRFLTPVYVYMRKMEGRGG